MLLELYTRYLKKKSVTHKLNSKKYTQDVKNKFATQKLNSKKYEILPN